MKIQLSILCLLAMGLFGIIGCSSKGGSKDDSSDTSTDSGTDTGTETDSTSDTETGTDTETDSGTDTGTETDSATDTNTELDTDTETVTDTETDSDSDTETSTESDLSFCASVKEIPESECEALLAFYKSTGGDVWKKAGGWLNTTKPCNWHGVTCAEGHVTALNFLDNNLVGTLPNEIGNLTYLINIDLAQNRLEGAIPANIGKLTNLDSLRLHINQFEGTLPPQIGDLTNLTELLLTSNKLEGPLPAEIGNLTNMVTMKLSSNPLLTTLPEELGNLTNLERLDIILCQITGTVPASFGNLVKLNKLDLNFNYLEGPIPSGLFDGFTEIGSLGFKQNQFSTADADEILAQIYEARNNYTSTYLYLDIAKNELPSGVHIDPEIQPGIGESNTNWSWNGECHIPVSGLAMLYALENDNCDEGFNTWTIPSGQ